MWPRKSEEERQRLAIQRQLQESRRRLQMQRSILVNAQELAELEQEHLDRLEIKAKELNKYEKQKLS